MLGSGISRPHPLHHVMSRPVTATRCWIGERHVGKGVISDSLLKGKLVQSTPSQHFGRLSFRSCLQKKKNSQISRHYGLLDLVSYKI